MYAEYNVLNVNHYRKLRITVLCSSIIVVSWYVIVIYVPMYVGFTIIAQT